MFSYCVKYHSSIRQTNQFIYIYVSALSASFNVTSPPFQNLTSSEYYINLFIYNKPCTSNVVNEIDNMEKSSVKILSS